MTFIDDQKEVAKLIHNDPFGHIEFAGIYRTLEFLDTMLHRVPDSVWVERKAFIKEYCKDKKILHLGCRGHSKVPNELHYELMEVCPEVWGIDIEDCPGLDHFIKADLEHGEWVKELIGRGFEIILATEILEHLSNAGTFLDKLHLFGCDVLLTVPNAFDHNRHTIMQIGIEYDNAQHVCYYSYHTIKTLIERHGFQLKEFLWADYPVQFFSRGLIFVLSPSLKEKTDE